jgi:hypothetical protein
MSEREIFHRRGHRGRRGKKIIERARLKKQTSDLKISNLGFQDSDFLRISDSSSVFLCVLCG